MKFKYIKCFFPDCEYGQFIDIETLEPINEKKPIKTKPETTSKTQSKYLDNKLSFNKSFHLFFLKIERVLFFLIKTEKYKKKYLKIIY